MALNRATIDRILTQAQGTRDLGSNAVQMLKQLFHAVVDDIAGASGISDAPLDGEVYGRQSAAWVEVTEEAPTDGQQYARQSEGWSVLSAGSLNSVLVGLTFVDRYKATATVLAAWASTARPPVAKVISPAFMDPDQMMLYKFDVVVGNIVNGVSFDVSLYTDTGYDDGSIFVMVIGA